MQRIFVLLASRELSLSGTLFLKAISVGHSFVGVTRLSSNRRAAFKIALTSLYGNGLHEDPNASDRLDQSLGSPLHSSDDNCYHSRYSVSNCNRASWWDTYYTIERLEPATLGLVPLVIGLAGFPRLISSLDGNFEKVGGSQPAVSTLLRTITPITTTVTAG